MSLNITCPVTTLPTISNVDCEVNFAQILRAGLGFIADATFVDETTFATSVAWAALVGSDDLQYTPLFNNFVLPQGEAATIGPDTNETFFGELKVVGKTTITPTGRFQGLPFDVKQELEGYLAAGAIFGKLGVYLIDEFSRLYGNQPGGTGTTVSPIPVSSFFIGDPGSEGYNTLTYTPFQWSFRGGWVDTIIQVTPDFDALIAQN